MTQEGPVLDFAYVIFHSGHQLIVYTVYYRDFNARSLLLNDTGGTGTGDGVGGSRWIKEIAVGVAGADGGRAGYGWGGGGGGRGLDMLEACWAVARDVDGVQGTRTYEAFFSCTLLQYWSSKWCAKCL